MEKAKSFTNTMKVSVPYRGATFLNQVKNDKQKVLSSFPSPIGELHFSITYLLLSITSLSFRPLSGSYISQYVSDYYYDGLCRGFPSPIGELHFSIRSKQLTLFQKVSVPYRGATFLNLCYRKSGVRPSWFPSPIGELHFSIPSPQPQSLSGTN